MRPFLNAAVILICAATHLFGQPSNGVMWRSERVHYSFPDAKPYWARIILPAENGATNGGSFKSVVDSIFRSEGDARIEHVCLGSVHRGAGMQKEVIDQLKNTVVLRRYPTRHGADGRMYVDGTPNPLSAQMCRLIKAAIRETSLVREMDEVLLPRGLHIGRVSTEKLCIFSEKGAYHWDAITWLVIERTERSHPANGSQPIRSGTNTTSPALGSGR